MKCKLLIFLTAFLLLLQAGVSAENSLELVTQTDLSGTKITRFRNPYSFFIGVKNKGEDELKYKVNMSFPSNKFTVKVDSPAGELFADELETQEFSIGPGSTDFFQMKAIPVVTDEEGTLEINVFRENHSVEDSLEVRFHTMTRAGNLVEFNAAPGLPLLSLLLLPLLVSFLGMKFFGF